MPSPFNRQIDHFLRCAHEKSLNAAAFKIGIAQSALTVSIRKLEDDLRVTLFERDRRGIRLTAKGRALYDRLTQYRDEWDRGLTQALKSTAALPLRLGSVEHFAVKYLFPFLASRPEGASPVHLFMLRSLHVYEGVELGRFDAGFVTWTRKPESLDSIPIKEEPLAIVGLKSRFGHIAKARSWDDLRGEPWLETPKPQYDPTRFVDEERDAYVAGGFFSHRHALLSGLAIGEAQLDAFSAEDLARLAIAPVKPAKGAWIYAIFRKGLTADARGRIDAAVSVVRKRVAAGD